jgi:hypothetical protein
MHTVATANTAPSKHASLPTGRFWLVVFGTSHLRFKNYSSAHKEAMALAREYPGRTAYVLQSIESVQINSLVITKL